MFYVYVLKSQKTKSLYKGHTDNLENRLKILNIGKLEYISDSENIAFSIILKDKN